MKQLFLTSSVNEVAQDIATRMDTKGKTLVFIDTAAEVEEGDKGWLNDDRQSLVDVGFLVTDYSISNKSTVELEHDLAMYDTIYVSGGNTFYLLQQAQVSGFIDVVRELVTKQGKTYIGTSAGSIIAGPDVSPDYVPDDVAKAPQIDGFLGFNLVNFCLLPHWGSDNFKESYLNGRIQSAYQEPQVPLLLLTNSQYVHVQDNKMEIIDVKELK